MWADRAPAHSWFQHAGWLEVGVKHIRMSKHDPQYPETLNSGPTLSLLLSVTSLVCWGLGCLGLSLEGTHEQRISLG